MNRKRLRLGYLCFMLMTVIVLYGCGTGTVAPSSTPTKVASPTEAASPAEVASPTARPRSEPPSPADCKPVPASENIKIDEACYVASDPYDFGDLGLAGYGYLATGFEPDEPVSTKLIGPDGAIIEEGEDEADSQGEVSLSVGYQYSSRMLTGQYTQIVEGKDSGHEAVGYFYFVGESPPVENSGYEVAAEEDQGKPGSADCPTLPPSKSMTIDPPCIIDSNISFYFEAEGFGPDEEVIVVTVGPDKAELDRNDDFWSSNSEGIVSFSRAVAGSQYTDGLYELTVEGKQSQHKAVGYFYFIKTP